MNIVLLALCLFFLPVAAAEAQSETPPAQEEIDQTVPGEEEEEEFFDPFAEVDVVDIRDPLEPLNRGVFWVNDKLYFYALKPVARAYRVVPEGARISVGNFFSNLATPIRFANNIFQLKFQAAGTELGRFVVNSTVGVAGLFDPASSYGWFPREEDFGQTLGHYGTGPGFYLVLPVLGPSTTRDTLGRVVDLLYDPVPQAVTDREYLTLRATDAVNTLSLDQDTYEAIKEQALDPYLFIRDAYVQRRQKQISQ
jgi:phospholipid-binding lipoprotein MlaA